MKKILLISAVILQAYVGAISIANQTAHDMYLTMKSVQTNMSIIGSNKIKYALIKANKTTQIPLLKGVNPLDDVVVEVFFTTNKGNCYHDLSGGTYKVKDFATGLLINIFNKGSTPNAGIIPTIWMKQQNLWKCNFAYKDVDKTAVSMPASKPN